MAKIGILTTFSSWAESYSLCHVVSAQVRMLKKAGIDPILFVNENFHGSHPDCEIRKIVPVFIYEEYKDVSSIPSGLTAKIKKALEENMKDIDVCFTHDILLQDSFLAHNLAVRIVNLPIIWYHWLHSQPTNVKINNLTDGHKLVFLNYTDRLAVAERFATWTDKVSIVYNTVEPHKFVGNKITELCGKIFEGKDIRVTYPFCATRMGAKGVAKLLKLCGKLKAEGKTIGLCLVSSNANGKREKESIENMKNLAFDYGLTDKDFVFTSNLETYLECGIPHEIVRDLFALSNMFILPSTVECCSLILLEAISAGNRLVLNEDIPSLKEFGGYKDAIYMKFGSHWFNTTYDNEDKYYQDFAKIILKRLKEPMENRGHLFSESHIWETQLKHLVTFADSSLTVNAGS